MTFISATTHATAALAAQRMESPARVALVAAARTSFGILPADVQKGLIPAGMAKDVQDVPTMRVLTPYGAMVAAYVEADMRAEVATLTAEGRTVEYIANHLGVEDEAVLAWLP